MSENKVFKIHVSRRHLNPVVSDLLIRNGYTVEDCLDEGLIEVTVPQNITVSAIPYNIDYVNGIVYTESCSCRDQDGRLRMIYDQDGFDFHGRYRVCFGVPTDSCGNRLDDPVGAEHFSTIIQDSGIDIYTISTATTRNPTPDADWTEFERWMQIQRPNYRDPVKQWEDPFPSRTVSIPLRLEGSLKEDLEALARYRDVTVDTIVNEAISRKLTESPEFMIQPD